MVWTQNKSSWPMLFARVEWCVHCCPIGTKSPCKKVKRQAIKKNAKTNYSGDRKTKTLTKTINQIAPTKNQPCGLPEITIHSGFKLNFLVALNMCFQIRERFNIGNAYLVKDKNTSKIFIIFTYKTYSSLDTKVSVALAGVSAV